MMVDIAMRFSLHPYFGSRMIWRSFYQKIKLMFDPLQGLENLTLDKIEKELKELEIFTTQQLWTENHSLKNLL